MRYYYDILKIIYVFVYVCLSLINVLLIAGQVWIGGQLYVSSLWFILLMDIQVRILELNKACLACLHLFTFFAIAGYIG